MREGTDGACVYGKREQKRKDELKRSRKKVNGGKIEGGERKK